MKEIVKFRISLFRERFSIYGISNIIVFFLFASLLLVGTKVVLFLLNDYVNVSLLIISFLFCFILGYIFPKNITIKELATLQLFDKLSVGHYQKYLKINRLVFFEIATLYLLFPVRSTEWEYFSAMLLIMQILILGTAMVWRFFNDFIFRIFRWSSTFLICFFLLFTNKTNLIQIHDIKISCTTAFVFFLINIIILIAIIKLIANHNAEHIAKNRPKKRMVAFSKITNRDFLYAVRTNMLLEPMLVVVIAAIMSFLVKESFEDTLLTHLFSFSYLLTEVYFRLLKYENKCYLIMGECSIKQLKKQKIGNTLKISVFIMVIAIVPLSLITSFLSVIVAYIISVILFLINSTLIKTNLEKKRGYRSVVTDKNQLLFLLVYLVEILVLTCIQNLLM